jgi:hypothetical protein
MSAAATEIWPLVGPALGPAVWAGIHGIGGGVWIGAVAFNLFVLTPRARAWFQQTGEHEDFVFSVVHGLRWPVLAGALAVVLTGIWRWRTHVATGSAPWQILMFAKLGCAAVSMGLFFWVTLRLWPRRVFATEQELPAVRRHFFAIGTGIVVANFTAAALGVLAGQLPR